MKEFLQICEYFEVTPCQFFDIASDNPASVQIAIDGIKKLNDDDLMLIIGNIRRLLKD